MSLPGAMLIALLQRAPVVRLAALADEMVISSPAGALLRSAVATAASLGAVHALAGATQFVANQNPVTGTVGTAISGVAITVNGAQTPPGSFKIVSGSMPPGLSIANYNATTKIINGSTVSITGTPTTAGSFSFSLRAYEFSNAQGDSFPATAGYQVSFAINAAAATAPVITTQSGNQSGEPGGTVTLNVTASGNPTPTFQWQQNGVLIDRAGSASLPMVNLQPANTGIYFAIASNSAGTAKSTPIVVGLNSTLKVIGTGDEVGPDTIHPVTHFTYDQILLTGAAASITADAGQITRMSYIDMNDDIVQVEFSGAGTVSLVLDSPSDPALPTKYNQPVNYVKGHAGIVVTGANLNSNLSVFSVGKGNAVNQALFIDGESYDGVADIAFIAISSTDGKFGGLRTADASYFATQGITGVYAPAVEFTGPVNIGDINADGNAIPMLVLGAADVTPLICGGNLGQANGSAVQVSGFTQLKFVDGSTSHNLLLPAQTNQARLEQNGADVTGQVVVNPSP